MDKNNPIGVFDSGVGGSSIWKEIHRLLPLENIVYLADSKNAPYGNKTSEEITTLSLKNTKKLLEFQCKIIVVACNTATTNAISTLREKYVLPIIGIEPAIKPAALKTKSKSIGILATKGTLSSTLFSQTNRDRKSTRLNSSHVRISYAVFCLKKKRMYLRSSPIHNAPLLLRDCLH